MAAPSRSRNYRKGVAVDLDQSEFLDILRGLSNFPKVASREMRRRAEEIADQIMVPAIKSAISSKAGGYAPKLNQSVKASTDRIPKVTVGQGPRGPRFSGGAATWQIRYGTIVGGYITSRGGARAGRYQFWADSTRRKWTDDAANNYQEPTFNAWIDQANQIITNWNRGRDY
jgi:hypothetical protein